MANFNVDVNATIADGSIANAKLADMNEATIKGRAAGAGTGDPQDLTASQARTALGLGTAATQDSTAFDAAGSASSAQAFAIQRANHTGTQLASTISDFNSAALAAAPAETTTTIGALINGASEKTTPVDADMVGLMDSAASNVLKKLSWANIKATLKTYFDGIYLLASNELPKVLGSTQTTSSNTLVDCTGLSVAVDANATYQIEGFILFQSASATNGIWMSVNGPTIGAGTVAINFNIPSSATANQGRNIIAYDGGSATTDVPALNTTYFALMNGTYITGATAGTLQFRFASEGAGTTVRIMAGSSLRLKKVA